MGILRQLGAAGNVAQPEHDFGRAICAIARHNFFSQEFLESLILAEHASLLDLAKRFPFIALPFGRRFAVVGPKLSRRLLDLMLRCFDQAGAALLAPFFNDLFGSTIVISP